MSKHNAIADLVVSGTNQAGKPYTFVNVKADGRDEWPLKLFPQECLRLMTALKAYGTAPLAYFMAKGMNDKETPFVGGAEYKGHKLLVFRMDAGDKRPLQMGKTKVEKLSKAITQYGLDAFLEVLRTVAGDAKPTDFAPRGKSKGKGKGKGQEENSRPTPEPAAQHTPEPRTQTPEPSPAPAPQDRLSRLELSIAKMGEVLEALKAEAAAIRAEMNKPEPPKPGTDDATPSRKAQPPRKGGKGFTVTHTEVIGAKTYGLCTDGVTRVLVQPEGRNDYWKVQTGRNPIAIKPLQHSTTPSKTARKAKSFRRLNMSAGRPAFASR